MEKTKGSGKNRFISTSKLAVVINQIKAGAGRVSRPWGPHGPETPPTPAFIWFTTTADGVSTT